MTMIYRKQPVTVVRDAHEGDIGFDHHIKHKQILIKHKDGTETAVPKDQVTDDAPHKVEVPHTAHVPHKTEVDAPRPMFAPNPKEPEHHSEHKKPVRKA